MVWNWNDQGIKTHFRLFSKNRVNNPPTHPHPPLHSHLPTLPTPLPQPHLFQWACTGILQVAEMELQHFLFQLTEANVRLLQERLIDLLDFFWKKKKSYINK